MTVKGYLLSFPERLIRSTLGLGAGAVREDAAQMQAGGSWSVYWYNGHLYSSEIARGLDILELTPSEHLSQNEIDAAKLVRFDVLNVQEQPQLAWPPSFVVARAYLDQLERTDGPCARPDRGHPERARPRRGAFGPGADRRAVGARRQLDAEAAGAADADKVRTLAEEVRDLTNAPT